MTSVLATDFMLLKFAFYLNKLDDIAVFNHLAKKISNFRREGNLFTLKQEIQIFDVRYIKQTTKQQQQQQKKIGTMKFRSYETDECTMFSKFRTMAQG